MQVGVDVECMRTNFGGRGLFGFGDKISLWSIIVEKLNRSELTQNFQVGVDLTCMYTNFGGCSFFGFGDFNFVLF